MSDNTIGQNEQLISFKKIGDSSNCECTEFKSASQFCIIHCG